MDFEKDENKHIKNIEKHKIDFKKAALVFLDKNRLIKELVWGQIFVLLCVVFTFRNNYKTTRIISARPLNRKEREEYYGDS